jgi:hypothetical protein
MSTGMRASDTQAPTVLTTVKRVRAGMAVWTNGQDLHCSRETAQTREVVDGIDIDDRHLAVIVMRSGRVAKAWDTDCAWVEVVTEETP